MDLSTWFHWVVASPGYFLLALVAVFLLFGLIGGLTDSRSFSEADNSPVDGEEKHSGMAWWKRDEEHYREWNAHQVREEHRIARKHSALD